MRYSVRRKGEEGEEAGEDEESEIGGIRERS